MHHQGSSLSLLKEERCDWELLALPVINAAPYIPRLEFSPETQAPPKAQGRLEQPLLPAAVSG